MAVDMTTQSIAVGDNWVKVGNDYVGDNPSGVISGGSGLASWPTDFTYAGAFRVPQSVTGGRTGYSEGLIALSNTQGNMFLSLHTTTDKGICEISIPTPSLTSDIEALPVATEVQGRFDVFNTQDGNTQGNNAIAGMYVHNSELIVSLVERYDADANNTKFYNVMKDPSNFATTAYEGQYAIEGAYHAAGWISPVPAELQSQIGYAHITGYSDNNSILSRASLGPSAFGINLDDVTAATVVEPIQTEAFQNYDALLGVSLAEAVSPLYAGQAYQDGNPVLSVMGVVGFGFIIPNTRTYACFGTQIGSNGTTYRQDLNPSGWYSDDPNDWNFAYWFFDIDDWIDVKNGIKQPNEITPYDYGPMSLEFGAAQGADAALRLRGGAFDPVANRLYLTVGKNYVPSGGEGQPIIYCFDVEGA